MFPEDISCAVMAVLVTAIHAVTPLCYFNHDGNVSTWMASTRPAMTFKSLSPPEEPLDISQLQFHIGRAAVIALARAGRALHLAQQRVHLLRQEPPAGADGVMAGERRQHMIELALKWRGNAFVLRKNIGEVA